MYIYIYLYVYLYIYIKLSPKWKNFQEQVFFFRFYILCENFSKIGPIIKKIPKFSDDPLNITRNSLSNNLQRVKLFVLKLISSMKFIQSLYS